MEEYNREEDTMHDPEEEATRTVLLPSPPAIGEWLWAEWCAVRRQPVERVVSYYYVKAAYPVIQHPDWDKPIINDAKKKGQWSLSSGNKSQLISGRTCWVFVLWLAVLGFTVHVINTNECTNGWCLFLLVGLAPSAACWFLPLFTDYVAYEYSIAYKLGSPTTNNKELTIYKKYCRWFGETKKLSTQGVKDVLCKVCISKYVDCESGDGIVEVHSRVSLRYANGGDDNRVVDLFTTPSSCGFHHTLYAAQQLEVAILGHGETSIANATQSHVETTAPRILVRTTTTQLPLSHLFRAKGTTNYQTPTKTNLLRDKRIFFGLCVSGKCCVV